MKKGLSFLITLLRLSIVGIVVYKRIKPFLPYIRQYMKSRKDISKAIREWRLITRQTTPAKQEEIVQQDG